MTRRPETSWVVTNLRRLQSQWPRATRAVVRAYLKRLRAGRARRSEPPFDQPFWILLPRWLHAAADRRVRRRLGPRFLAEICWAQYCLFLFVRIHDDLFDRQAGDRRLIFVADQLLLESERTFARQLGPDFLDVSRDALGTTLLSILEMDADQRTGRGGRLSDHARVASIFKVGATAVAIATGRRRALPALGRLMDDFAVLSQTIDDVVDLEQDLRDGRITPAGALLLGRRARRPSTALLSELEDAMVVGPGADRLVDALRRHSRRALSAAVALHLPAAIAHAQAVTMNVERIALAIHESRVATRFGLTPATPQNPRVTAPRI